MRNPSPFLSALLAGALALCAPSAAGAEEGPGVESVRVQSHDGFTRILLETDAPVEPNLFTLGEPHRLVIDLPAMAWRIPASAQGALEGGLVRGYRFGLFQPGVSRLVLNLSGPARVLERERLRGGAAGHAYRIDLAPRAADEPALAGGSGLPEAQRVGRDEKVRFSSLRFDLDAADFEDLSVALDAPLEDALAALAVPDPDRRPMLAPEREPAASRAIREEKPAPPAEAKPARPPLRIVLDPGHGGIDPGTGTGEGLEVPEKAINLAFAQALAALLEAEEGVEVFLTRDRDVKVPLPARVAFARRKRADLFISIHADWSDNPYASGATAYTLSEKASVKTLEDIAAEPGAAGEVAGVDLAAERADVARLLVDLARRETQARSLSFAEAVIAEVAKETPVIRRPIRRQNFHVLRAPDMPSVLLELGFISNEGDRALLTDEAWRDRTAAAVVRAVAAWRASTASRDFANR